MTGDELTSSTLYLLIRVPIWPSPVYIMWANDISCPSNIIQTKFTCQLTS